MATIPSIVEIPENGFLSDEYPLTDVTNSLQRTMNVKGKYIRRIEVQIEVTVNSVQTSAATGFIHQLLALSSVTNKVGKLVAMFDGRSSLIANKMINPSNKMQAMDYQLTGTKASTYVYTASIPVNFPSYNAASFEINLGGASSITGLTAGISASIGVIIKSTNDLVGEPYRFIGGSFTGKAEAQFYQASAEQSRYQIIEVGTISTTDMIGFSSFATPDGNLSPTAILQYEIATGLSMGIQPTQGPVGGAAGQIAYGNTTNYFVLLYRSKVPGNAGFTASSNYTGAWGAKALVPMSELA